MTEESRFLIAALAPTVTGLVAIATTLVLGGRLEARIDRISDDLKVFYRDIGKHEARLDSLERKQ